MGRGRGGELTGGRLQRLGHDGDVQNSMTDLDFLWVGAWPDYARMGSGLGNLFNSESGSATSVKFERSAPARSMICTPQFRSAKTTANKML